MDTQITPVTVKGSTSRPLRDYWLVVFVFIAMVSVSHMGARLVRETNEKTNRFEFERTAHIYSSALESEITANLSALRYLGALFESSNEVSRTEFDLFVASIADLHDSTIETFFWIPKIPGSERDRFEGAVRSGGQKDFHITEWKQQGEMIPALPRQEYFPIQLEGPASGNEFLAGFDLGSDPDLLASLVRCGDSGKILMVPFIGHGGERFRRTQSLVVLPVYNSGTSTGTPEQRRKSLRGFVATFFLVGEIVEKSSPLPVGDPLVPFLFVHLYGVSEDRGGILLYPKSEQHQEPGHSARLWNFQERIYAVGREFLIELLFDAAAHGPRGEWVFRGILYGGILVSALLSLFLLFRMDSIRRSRETAAVIQESEEHLRNMLNNSSALISIKDQDGRYTFVNREFEKQFSFRNEKIKGKTDHELFPQEIAEAIDSKDQEALSANSPLEFEEELLLGGEYRALVSSRFSLRDSRGDVYAICSISTDITETKNLESQLRQAQKMEVIGQLAGGIAHDINNILAVIQGNIDMLERELAGEDCPHLRIGRINKATSRAEGLIMQLLGFSRDQDKGPVVVNINKIIEDLGSFVSRTVTSELEIRQNLAQDLWATEIEPGDFQDSLLNLLVNARDAMDGTGELVLETRNCTVDEDFCRKNIHARPGPYVELSVSDTGEGMPEEIIGNIFEPFFSTKEVGKGTGLGLSMVFGFVKRSGGVITVDSKPGTGTTFKLYLPKS